MSPSTAERLAERRRVEDALLQLAERREALERASIMNQQRLRQLLKRARELHLTVREVSELTGVSPQTLHTWMREVMEPIPAVHLGLIGPAPTGLAESVLRTMGEDPEREWVADDVRGAIPESWPTGSTHEVTLALGALSRSLQIWQTDNGYRIAPPDDAQEWLP